MTTMPRLRSKAYLTCFYCGRKTSTRNDGSVRRFECPSCEATNYLDENGEITDPPLEATAPSGGSDDKPPTMRDLLASQPDNDVFCAECLKNQRLFTASLAQYLPGDPDDPEYDTRERNFYKFRNNLERQYPQTCSKCEPKVLERIAQAGYTAKTDHLRRMIDRSLKARTAEQASASGPLGILSAVGRYLWLAGFILQGLWHLEMMQELVATVEFPWLRSFGIRQLLGVLAWLLSLLPEPEWLMKWSIMSTAVSLWWNPFFVKTVRGFTKHLLGIGTWYTYQAVIMFFRVLAPGIPNLSREHGSAVSAQITMHSLTCIFMFYITKLALGSIRVDTTPLFGNKSLSTPKPPDVPPQAHQRGPSGNTMLDTLDEVLASPIPARESDSETETQSLPPKIRPRYTEGPLRGQQMSQRGGLFAPENARGSTFGRQDDAPQQTEYASEMDWQPTESPPRAFNPFSAPEQPLRSFNDAPVNDKHGPFWFKVPPAPATSMARRGLNSATASSTALLQKQPEPVQQRRFFASRDEELRKEQEARDERNRKEAERTKYIKSPSFRYRANDPRDPLSDMFEDTFKISPTRAAPAQQAARNVESTKQEVVARQVKASDFSILILSALLLIPGYETVVPMEYGVYMALSICCTSLIIWVRVNLETFKTMQVQDRHRSKAIAYTVATGLALSEVGFLAWTGMMAQDSGEHNALMAFSSEAKTVFLSLLVIHQVWNLFAVQLVVHP
ncbi:hypothetical protein MCOR25_010564 [Pyricularia grisea]|nr:hypothetical protein MCOR25_010564 [Pyricularia grisea]